MKLRCKTTMFDKEKKSSLFHLSKKTIMIMRISLFHIFLLTCGTHMILATEMNGQNLESISVDIELHNQDIKTLFKKIESKTGLLFAYQPQTIKDFPKVTTPRGSRSVSDILNTVFQGSNLVYKQVDKSIVIYKKENESKPAKVNRILTGIITDQAGMPLSGVTLSIPGTNLVEISDYDGQFSFEIPDGKVTIKVSYVGYKTREIAIEDQTKLTIKMTSDLSKLDEVVVIGYGTTTKRSSTGSVVKITSEDIKKQPVTNILQTLQGRAPGVFVTQTSGYAGSDINISIRGRNSVDDYNIPLYIIDGIPYIGSDLKGQAQEIKNYVIKGAQKNTSPLNILNPNDIASIEILKDADATAIYGSRGANGVVLITTKKGSSGKTEFTINTNSGISEVANRVKTLDTPAYRNMLQTALTNAKANPSNSSTGIALTDWDPNAQINWQDELIGGTANFNDFSASLKGGNETTNFLLSGAYHKETTVLPNDFGYNKFSTNFNINHTTLNKKLKLEATVMFATDKNKLPFFDITNYAITTAPNHPIYNADGTFYWAATYFSDINPLAALGKRVEDKGSNLITSFNINYKIAKGLSFKTDFGYGFTEMLSKQTLPATASNYAYYNLNKLSLNTLRSYTVSNNNASNFTIDPQLNYVTSLWKGNLTALAGMSYQDSKSEMPSYVSTSGYSSDNLIGFTGTAATVTSNNGSLEYKYVSMFSRLNYNIASKYILNANFRRDGSSKFGPNNKYGNFGSVAAAWVFSEEDFIKKDTWLSFGKLRTSYGEVGSDGTLNYGFLDTFSAATYGNGNASLSATRLANPNYQWQVSKKFETAVDLNFLDDKISFTAAFYRNITGNQLVGYPISAQSGFTSYAENMGAKVENKGWEFTLTTNNVNTKNLNWSSSFNISTNSNKLLAFPGIEYTSYYSQYVAGKPLNSMYLYKYTGIQNGIPQVEDANGDGKISTGLAATGAGDRQYLGATTPKYYGGISNSISYKSFSFDFLFQFVKQTGRTLMTSIGVQPGYPYGLANFQTDEYNDYIAQGNTLSSNYLPSYFNYLGSDATIVDASYIKLKNVSASYIIPLDQNMQKVIKNLRVSLQGQNLVTFTKYKGFDPESPGLVLPPMRTITFGTQLTF